MTELLRELEAVALLADKATPGEWPKPEFPENSPNEAFIRLGAGYLEFGGSMRQRESNAEFISAAVNFIRTHHAEIAEAVKDARRYRAARECAGSVGIYEGLPSLDSGVSLLLGDDADAAIDATTARGRLGNEAQDKDVSPRIRIIYWISG